MFVNLKLFIMIFTISILLGCTSKKSEVCKSDNIEKKLDRVIENQQLLLRYMEIIAEGQDGIVKNQEVLRSGIAINNKNFLAIHSKK